MAETLKGLTIQIGAETTGLSKALEDVNKKSKDTATELNKVTKLLKFNPSDTTLITQKQKLLGNEIGVTKEKLQKLKDAQVQINEQYKKGDISEEQYRSFQREIVATEGKLKHYENELKNTTSTGKKLGETLQKAGEKMSSIGQGISSVGSKLTLGLTTPIIGAGIAAANLASDMNENMNKVDVAFKKNSGEVKNWSNSTLKNFGIAKGTALDMSSLFGDMGTAMGLNTDKAADMSMSLVGLAGDLASFKNIGIDQAQDALKGIFTGEGESLKTLGVIMTDTTLKEYAHAKGVKKKYEEMTQAEKVNLRYNYVMEKTKNAQGDFARTSDGTANSTRIFQESVKQLGATMGQNLLPVVTPIIQKLSEMIQKFGNLSPEMQGTIIKVAAIVAAVGPALVIGGKLITTVGKTASAFGKVGSAIKGAGGIIGALTSPIGITILVIGGLIAIGILLWKNWDKIKAKAAEIGTAISKKWNDIKTSTVNTWNYIKEWPGKKLEESKTAINQKIGAIKGYFAAFKPKFPSISTSPLDVIRNSASGTISKIKGFFAGLRLKLPSISFPHINLPHFSLQGGFSIVPPRVPKLNISWYAKGGILTQPTLFGMNSGNLLGGGEAGREAVVPLSEMYQRIDEMLDKKLSALQPIVYVTNLLDGDEISSKTQSRVSNKLALASKGRR